MVDDGGETAGVYLVAAAILARFVLVVKHPTSGSADGRNLTATSNVWLVFRVGVKLAVVKPVGGDDTFGGISVLPVIVINAGWRIAVQVSANVQDWGELSFRQTLAKKGKSLPEKVSLKKI